MGSLTGSGVGSLTGSGVGALTGSGLVSSASDSVTDSSLGSLIGAVTADFALDRVTFTGDVDFIVDFNSFFDFAFPTFFSNSDSNFDSWRNRSEEGLFPPVNTFLMDVGVCIHLPLRGGSVDRSEPNDPATLD